MFLITIAGKEEEGAYSVHDEDGEKALYLFEEEDDAIRYLLQLEESDDTPDLEVLDVEQEVIISACRSHGQKYSIISSDDFIIPPDDLYD